MYLPSEIDYEIFGIYLNWQFEMIKSLYCFIQKNLFTIFIYEINYIKYLCITIPKMELKADFLLFLEHMTNPTNMCMLVFAKKKPVSMSW